MFDLFWELLSEEEKNEFTERIKKDLEKFCEDYKKYHINENIEVYRQINDIRNYIYDYYYFGTLVDLESGEKFTLSTGINMIEDLLKDVEDEVYVKYEKDRIEEIIKMFERRLNDE